MEQTFEVGQPVIWLHEARGGYSYVQYVLAIVIKPGKKRIGIAALTKRGEWVPRYVKAEKLAIERETMTM